MMEWILGLIPWWVYAVAALAAIVAIWRLWGWPAALAAATAALAFLSYRRGRAEGVSAEHEKQVAADTHARDVIHDTKEDVRSIPATPAGKAERKKRFDRWVK